MPFMPNHRRNWLQLAGSLVCCLLLVLLVALGIEPAAGQGTDADSEAVSSSSNPVDRTITLQTVPGEMAYKRTEFFARPGERIRVVLKNLDALQHNVVICKQGEMSMAVAMAREAWTMENARHNDYVPPNDDRVLAASEMVGPDEQTAFVLQVPEQTGDHPYVCTFPGHASSMNGIMHVRPASELITGQDGQLVQRGPLRNLRYSYYEGDWNQLPDFSRLKPVAKGKLPEGRVTIDSHKREEGFGFRFQGQLPIEQAGSYTFQLASDDGSQLYIDGQLVVDHDGLHGPTWQEGTVTLQPGTHDFTLNYFEKSGGQALMANWQGPDSDLKHLSVETGEPAVGAQQREAFQLSIDDQPRVMRLLLPDSSPRSIAVGLPSGVRYCFDAKHCFVRYGWTGPFLNVGPERGFGQSRGGQVVDGLGPRFAISNRQPLRLGSPNKRPAVQFRGYRRGDGPPTMLYTVVGLNVTQRVEKAKGGRGLHFTYQFESAPKQPVYFVSDVAGLQIKGSAGRRHARGWQVPASTAKQFTITVLHPKSASQ
jgi:uncharacterized cupredoxin-like copper-binding protein